MTTQTEEALQRAGSAGMTVRGGMTAVREAFLALLTRKSARSSPAATDGADTAKSEQLTQIIDIRTFWPAESKASAPRPTQNRTRRFAVYALLSVTLVVMSSVWLKPRLTTGAEPIAARIERMGAKIASQARPQVTAMAARTAQAWERARPVLIKLAKAGGGYVRMGWAAVEGVNTSPQKQSEVAVGFASATPPASPTVPPSQAKPLAKSTSVRSIAQVKVMPFEPPKPPDMEAPGLAPDGAQTPATANAAGALAAGDYERALPLYRNLAQGPDDVYSVIVRFLERETEDRQGNLGGMGNSSP